MALPAAFLGVVRRLTTSYKARMPTLSDLHASQPTAVTLLRQSLQHERLHQAYILTGSPASPRAAVAEALCATLVCAQPTPAGDACGACSSCRKLAGSNHPDFLHLKPSDKGSISTDAVRDMTARLGLRSTECRVKLVRIDAADSLLPAAQNALLKTLEEPPGAALFLLLTTRLRALLPTIRSRCQTVRLAAAPAAGWEEIAAEEPLKGMLLAASDGEAPRAQQWLENDDIAAIWQTLQTVLPPHTEITQVVQAAADLGGDRRRTDLALMLVEVWLRDQLAQPAHPRSLAAGVGVLQQARRTQMLHLNRPMLLENLLLTLNGAQPPL